MTLKLLSFPLGLVCPPTVCADYGLLVQLWDGAPGVGKSIGRYCKGRPDPVVSKTNHVYVRFHSDAVFTNRGFALDYESSE